MLMARTVRRSTAFIASETALIFGSVMLMAYTRAPHAGTAATDSAMLPKALLIALGCQLCLYARDLYERRVSANRQEVFVRLFQALGATSIVFAVVYTLFPSLVIGRGVFVGAVTPLMFPTVLPASAVEDVRASKARIEEIVRAQGKADSELKRGRGGIRDVEFAVQLLQLVHGRRHPRLREPGTLPLLEALADEGFVAPADAEALAGSYRFLVVVKDAMTGKLVSDNIEIEVK